MLGDVSGKGIAASMLMSHLHAKRFGVSPKAPPARSPVEAANRIFCGEHYRGTIPRRSSWTSGPRWFGGVLSTQATFPCFTSMGMDYSKDSTECPWGCSANISFPVHRFTLAHGDTLFLYTDGLTESRNHAGAEYGLQRIRTLAAGTRG